MLYDAMKSMDWQVKYISVSKVVVLNTEVNYVLYINKEKLKQEDAFLFFGRIFNEDEKVD